MDNYNTIAIGKQIWMDANLNVSQFRNGDKIPQVKINEHWKREGDEGRPACCYYDNDPSNGKKYGGLYNWYAVNDPRGLAPLGWHIPSDEEWTQLETFLDIDHAESMMKSAEGWEEGGNGNNESCFNALPAGYRYYYGSTYIGKCGIWWSSTECYEVSAWNRFLNYNKRNLSRGYIFRGKGLSVRCIKD
ncbi:MAG TPA: hypothetical protein EYM84_08935 [Flavobacteriales bacterium]|nr:hypothetical protein [Flavobacteriales bacterium]